MADNYLEKKFEEYAAAKAGRRAPHRMSPAGNRQGVVEFKFPRRRVVVAVPDADAVIEAFCNAGCQVAFCGTDIDGGQAYAEAVGAQFNPVNEFCAETLCRAMSRVMKAWRDIEIVICTADMAPAITSHWRTLRSALPMEPDYGRVVVIGPETAKIPAIPNATVNAIVCRDIDNAVASACLFSHCRNAARCRDKPSPLSKNPTPAALRRDDGNLPPISTPTSRADALPCVQRQCRQAATLPPEGCGFSTSAAAPRCGCA